MSGRTTRGLVAGGVVGSVAAGIAAGVALEKLVVGRTRLRPDPEAAEPFGRLPGRTSVVTLPDGVVLHVEETGSGPLTVVFCHGWALSLASWHYQRKDLDDVARLVFYDHRAHGRSTLGDSAQHSIDQLGRDLGHLLDEVAPTGPVALVGHSMGGMTIMALADQRADLFGTRVVGVVLIGTSAGRLIDIGPALSIRATAVLTNQVLPRLQAIATKRSRWIERGRRMGSDVSFLLNRFTGFGANASPAQVEFVERMIAATPIQVISSFSGTFPVHDKFEALATLGTVPVLVLAGADDRLTPLSHAREIVARASGAELITFEGAGHMVMFERAPLVNLHLRAFFRRITKERARAAGRGA
ncbi:MAG TPA: alpha/beta hydrolase [Mycobacteriales bacterium]|nr:alpha/beta hydrolase [Mycobacteriales bacterium]